MEKVRTRFAPSPTGYLHIGGLRTAMYAYLFAKKNGGDFILRIEDTDLERYVEGAVEIIYRTLKDAGLHYDEGPDIGGDYGPYVQTQRKEIYLKYAKELVERGGAYYCFCTKERLESLKDENGLHKYDKHCLHLSKAEVDAKIAAGEKYVIRQNIPESGSSVYEDMVFGEIAVDYKDLEDNILIKSDGYPTYNFANVIDDHLMKISHVIRGTEYLSSTPKYNLLYDAFGWQRPQYIHLPPIMKDAHQKLSKRNGDASYEDLLKKGYLKEAIVNYIALLGWSPKNNTEKMTLKELEENFDIAGISKSASIFDPLKLKWLNGEYIKALPVGEFDRMAKPYYAMSDAGGMFDSMKLSRLMITRTELLTEIPQKIDFLAHFDRIDPALYCHKKMKTTEETAKRVLPEAVKALEKITDWNEENVHAALDRLIQKLELKNGQVFWPVRIAITNQESTPGGATELADILGKELTVARLKKAIEWLEETK